MEEAVNQSHAYWQNCESHPERIPLGLSSFNQDDQHKLGESLRLSMAFVQGAETEKPTTGKAMPSEPAAIAARLKTLGQDITSNLADQLELMVRFDDLGGWKASGARHCVAYMNLELGISHSLSWEYLRVGRKLRDLPVTRALFRAGQLTWSKIRLITRVADPDNECALCHSALDASVSQVATLCDGYLWQDDDNGKSENDRATQQWESRSFIWNTASNGNTRICLSLPPETAKAFLNSVEHTSGQLEGCNSSMAQRRADAAVLMAENSLQFAGRDIATADRYQVIVQVDATDIQASHLPNMLAPKKKPSIQGASAIAHPIARDTARRLSCDCTVSSITTKNGEPVDIGQKSRVWPVAMTRAIKSRDQHCQWPGCAQTQHLQIHHIKHWADGGSTSISNGVCLCSAHHTQVHEGGYQIQRVDHNPQRLDEQFQQQTTADGSTAFEAERLLRNSRESFDYVRRLSPTRFRFRVVDQQGRDIRNQRVKNSGHSTCIENSRIYDTGPSYSSNLIAEPLSHWCLYYAKEPTQVCA